MILKMRAELRGGHVHADVFVGPDLDHLALSGRLVFTEPEWATLRVDAVDVVLDGGERLVIQPSGSPTLASVPPPPEGWAAWLVAQGQALEALRTAIEANAAADADEEENG